LACSILFANKYQKCLGYFQKSYCYVTSGNRKYPIFYQFMHTFLVKVRINQSKIITGILCFFCFCFLTLKPK